MTYKCKLLEENSFTGRTADLFYMLISCVTVLTGIVLVGSSDIFGALRNFFELCGMCFPCKPNKLQIALLLRFIVSRFIDQGMIAGHAYYFLEAVYP
ncbi:derlin-2.2-like [Mercurialis annua]|uniref:derlin-2.2-like n=1 Tax=Mercurialis annua TaxID=3986 RepID=UPI0024AFF001|nr:derlin-2.2-like [Mercurialis annua]